MRPSLPGASLGAALAVGAALAQATAPQRGAAAGAATRVHEAPATATEAAAFRAGGEPVVPDPDGLIVCEGEEFKPEGPGWHAGRWGENAYAATFANTFLSRKAFLGAPEQCAGCRASIAVDVKEAGRYLVLARYEAAYRFETRFRLRVEQGGRLRFDREYGARANPKVWAFGSKIQPEVAWPWGATENVVWEGHDTAVELQPGRATVRLIAERQPGDAARRVVDLVLLTRDTEGVRRRIETEGYLPLDGLLTQAGDVWLRATNDGGAAVTVRSLRLLGGPFQQHSPYWVHQRTWKPVSVAVGPGETSEWVEVGSTMDSLNDGQWGFESSGPARLELALRTAAGRLEPLRSFAIDGRLPLVGLADTRYSRAVPTPAELEHRLLGALRAVPTRGRLPSRLPVYGSSSLPALERLFGLSSISGKLRGPHAYVDWRGRNPAQLEQACAALDEERRREIAVVSLGDEIRLPEPDPKAAAAGFATYLEAQGVRPEDLDPGASDWSRVAYDPDPKLAASRPGLFHWSQRYRHALARLRMKEHADVLRRCLPNAGIGANFSPHGGAAHAYLGEVSQWVSCFREQCLTLPWSEDYAWQIPVGTPQMSEISLDLFRAGLRARPGAPILFYVMPHSPGNTPRMWRRMFHAALAHGMKLPDLFQLEPVWTAYTENHVTSDAMYATILTTLRELGGYEDLVADGTLPEAQAGLWFSETSDVWGDSAPPFGAAKRALWVAIRHAQAPLDVVVEQDALEGGLSRYRALYLADRHVSRAASGRIADWVRDGGTLFATAGAGMRDEYDQPNRALRALLPVDVEIEAPERSQVGYIKQDLPFANALGQVASSRGAFPVFGAVARLSAKPADVTARFFDGGPALIVRSLGRGRVIYTAFLPGLSYFRPAIPRRPLDRGDRDDAMSHFLPTELDATVGALIAEAVASLPRPVRTSVPLVEATLVRSPAGLLVPLVNWTAESVHDLRVTLQEPLALRRVSLASGSAVRVMSGDGPTVVVVETLDAADALILR